ncbi:MAG TPA: LysM peptidoglycan-binding domain-containing protein [Anaerolineaceae bacterium]|nr:LysM peptidoglycan-binding domain-containing protein [Anaerolineaceae bacterium]
MDPACAAGWRRSGGAYRGGQRHAHADLVRYAHAQRGRAGAHPPTPDQPHAMPTPRTETDTYTIQAGDQLGRIAERFGISLQELIDSNGITNPDHVEPGQTLTVPVPAQRDPGPDFKIIPDSELVAGPASAGFELTAFIQGAGGYLASYQGEIDEKPYTGAQIVARVSSEFSVNPRLLLAVLEFQSGWVYSASPDSSTLTYPMGQVNPNREGLYKQLTWTADALNYGYYMWKVSGVSSWMLSDGSVLPIAPSINAGTAGVQHLLALLNDEAGFRSAVSPTGLYATYQKMFGYPFDYTIEPLAPAGIQQPALQLPFETGVPWYLTGGPHGGWGDGSAWAAIDFAPPGEELGCFSSDVWEVASADGLVITSEDGRVVQDLDGDGFAQTGWTILYMHVENRDRVAAGTYLKAGERIGHPSCEGGVSNGTHLHLARRYNGEWISADGPLPINLDGWVSSGNGIQYDGYMTRNEHTLEAWEGRFPENEIQR